LRRRIATVLLFTKSNIREKEIIVNTNVVNKGIKKRRCERRFWYQ
jgi:hypothetical protein